MFHDTFLHFPFTQPHLPQGNLIYLSIISDRVPIIGKFIPSHVGGHVQSIQFGEVFDVPRLRRSLGKPVLEWQEVKDETSEIVEDLGCWNTWEVSQENEKFPRRTQQPYDLKLGEQSSLFMQLLGLLISW
jgi:hypothetical protein